MAKVGLLKQCFLEFFPFFRAVLMLEFGSESVVETTKFEFPTGGKKWKKEVVHWIEGGLEAGVPVFKGIHTAFGMAVEKVVEQSTA